MVKKPNGADHHQPRAPRRQKQAGPPTRIAELRLMPFATRDHAAVLEVIRRADAVQEERLNAVGGASVRYRIELAAAFLAFAVHSTRDAAGVLGVDGGRLEALTVKLVVARAQELVEQDPAAPRRKASRARRGR